MINKVVFSFIFISFLTGCSTKENFGPVSDKTQWKRVKILDNTYRVWKVENQEDLYGSVWDSNLLPPYHVTHAKNRVLAIEKHTRCEVDPKTIVVLMGETTLANVACQ